jgi:hypothetical protein
MVDKRNDTNEEIAPAGRDQDQTVKKAKVSHEHKAGETYLKVSRCGNRDGGELGQEFRREWKIHRARWPDRQLENKNKKTQKKNKRETYLGEWEESQDEKNCGRRTRKPAKLNCAHRPTSGRNKNKVLPVCRYAMRLVEPQYGWQSRNTIGDTSVWLTLFLAAAINWTN